MVNVSVDLTSEQLDFLEGLRRRGLYRSRSEAVRDVLRRAQFDWAWKDSLVEAKDKGISSDIAAEREAVSKELSGRFAHA
jgi:Arc/MetJ-type ribon-helix-helix transcriptional regulator